MARPKEKINPLCGLRVKTVIEDKDLTQYAFAELLGTSQQNISKIVNGTASVTRNTAEKIVELFPEYRLAWLLGMDDIKTGSDSLLKVFSDCNMEGKEMLKGLVAFASLSGFTIGLSHPLKETNTLENLHEYLKGYTVSRNGSSATISFADMNELQNDICDYIEFKLERLIRKQNTVPETHNFEIKNGIVTEKEDLPK